MLLITSPAGDEGLEYLVELERLADRGTCACAMPRTGSSRTTRASRSTRPTRSRDAYLAADLITYPSLYEGFGNALVEAIFYGKPVVVNRYAVYDADIAPLGLRLIELDGAITDATVARSAPSSPIRASRARSRGTTSRSAREHLGYDVCAARCRAAALLSEPAVAGRPDQAQAARA